jgi:AmmeMemoRadiSam system protein B
VAAVAWPFGGSGTTPSQAPVTAHPVAFFDQRAFADGFARAEARPAEPLPGARVVIIPHHWVPGYLILGQIRDLAATREITRVVLVGPDHVNAGASPASTSTFAWNTPFGQLQPDTPVIDRLIGTGLVTADPDVLANEHSVAGIVHAVANYMPNAKVVPLALRHDMTWADVTALAREISGLVDEKTAVVAAVDFSHYLSAREAELKDAETLSALQAMDQNLIMGWDNDHLDSPPSIALAIEISRLLGDQRFVLTENTNSGILTGTLSPPVTSYIAGYYTR